MKEDYIQNTEIQSIEPRKVDQFKQLDEVYTGKNTEEFLKTLSLLDSDLEEPAVTAEKTAQKISDFRKKCQELYVTLCETLKIKCNFSENRDLRFIFHQNNVFSDIIHEQYPTLDIVFENYSQLKASKNQEE